MTQTADRLLTLPQAAAIIGVHSKNVGELVRAGLLVAKLLTVRGKGKRRRYRILESEVERYIRDLPEWEPDKKTERATSGRTRQVRRLKQDDKGVIQFV